MIRHEGTEVDKITDLDNSSTPELTVMPILRESVSGNCYNMGPLS